MLLPDRLQLPLRFDPALLARDLGLATGWRHHASRDVYEGDWSVIALRAPAYATHPVQMIYADPHTADFKDTPALAGCAYFRDVFAAFQAPLRAARLMRLGAGAIIKEHEDRDIVFEDGLCRLHVPIATNPLVDFRLNGRRVVMEAGSVWYLRLCDPHSVTNAGEQDRVHLVIDVAVNDWMTRLCQSCLEGAA
jgi:hypothetical protein